MLLRVAAVLAADADVQPGPDLAAELDRHLHQLAHPALVDGGERVLRRGCPAVRYSVRKPVSASSREMPKVVWVRSLVPKEKNCAQRGDLVGGERRAGDLDHRPELVAHLRASARPSPSSPRPPAPAARTCSSLPWVTSGIMIFGLTSTPVLGAVAGGLEDGAHLHAHQRRACGCPSRTPRRPSIGFCSRSRSTAAEHACASPPASRLRSCPVARVQLAAASPAR